MKFYADTFLIKLQFLALASIIVATIQGWSGFSSTIFAMTFFLTVALWWVVSNRRIGKKDLVMFVMVFLSCVSVLINAMITDTMLSFSFMKKIIMFWSTLIFFATMCDYEPNQSTVEFIFKLNTIIALFYILVYFTRTEEVYSVNGRITRYLYFQFTNPNLAAMFLSAICVIELLDAYALKSWKTKFLHLILSGFLIFFIVKTQSRTALILMAIFIVTFLIAVFFPRWKLKMTSRIAALVAIFPVLFSVVYMLIVDAAWFNELFSFMTDVGKGLDSRVRIWTTAFQSVMESPIIGAYSQISSGGGFSQMHNSHIDVAASYGLPVMILLCIFLHGILYDPHRKQKTGMQFVCLAGFSALLLSGIGEALVFSGGLGIYVLMGIVLMLANYDWQ